MFNVFRLEENPLISPLHNHPWEAAGAFNWCALKDKGITRALYRALSEPERLSENHIQLSTIGYAESTDGVHFSKRRQFIVPEKEYERYGCEDPRVTKLGNTYYIFYTALSNYPFDADGIKVAVATTKDFKKIDAKHLVTPFNAKAMALFPAKIGGKMAALLTVNTDRPPSKIAYVEFEKEEDIWSPVFWERWYKNLDAHTLPIKRFDDDHIELGAPALKTKAGWLLIYCHIQHYGKSGQSFGIEALLLDLKNPRTIIGRTKGSFMAAEEHYEKIGNTPNIVFPSGALIKGKKLQIFYGAADTHSALAEVDLKSLLDAIIPPASDRILHRFVGNPIITPRPGLSFEAKGTFNPAAIELEGSVHILYRAMGDDSTSTFGYARSRDGFSIDERLDKPIYKPRADFEAKKRPGNSGCEDPRITKIDDLLYVAYTAFDGEVPRVAVSSISVPNFLEKKWQWSEPLLFTPPNIDDKDACFFPEKINGHYLLFHRVGGSVCAVYLDSLDAKSVPVKRCLEIINPRPGMWDGEKVGIAAPPIKCKEGWLLLYHGVSKNTNYRLGAILLDKKDPTIVLARTAIPFLEPVEEYERVGQIPNVVFPCGAVNRDGTIFIYYGAADYSVAVATIKLSDVLRMLSL